MEHIVMAVLFAKNSSLHNSWTKYFCVLHILAAKIFCGWDNDTLDISNPLFWIVNAPLVFAENQYFSEVEYLA